MRFMIVAVLAAGIYPSHLSLASEKAVNKSGISFSFDNPTGGAVCSGTTTIDLADVGITVEQLRDGVQCVAGDFDGNGHLDFALRGAKTEKRGIEYFEAVAYKIVFYGKKGALKTQIIPSSGPGKLQLYPPTNVKGRFGEPPTKRDGLVSWGGGELTHIYLYDDNSGLMKPSTYESEHY